MIGIVDYGLGNIRAFSNIYKKLNIPFVVVRKADDLVNVERIILPGVGSFDYAMELVENSGMKNALDDMVLRVKVPVLGVCVGMQMMASASEEGSRVGLNWVGGRVRKFDFKFSPHVSVPHMGWNTIDFDPTSGLLAGLDSSSRFYFLHSYYFDCENAENILATTNYGCEFSCAVREGNIYGVQFHPEKSHHWGEKLLENFSRL